MTQQPPHYITSKHKRTQRSRLTNITMAMVWASKAASFLNISAFNRSFASAVLKDLKYADSHEWAKIEGNSATIGITDHAQDHLGDVVYVELPEVGTAVTQGSGFGAVESVKATSDINSPVSGKVVEVNQELSTSPGLELHPQTRKGGKEKLHGLMQVGD
nr:glycine cleavage system H protein 2, mitochondrial-like [Tanacetum cinerariifolium]